MSSNHTTIQVPASTSNCGPGFDTLGIALNLYNFVRLYWTGDTQIESYKDGALNSESLAMIREAEAVFRSATGQPKTGFKLEIWGDVPISRGLGSSAVLRGGVVAALNAYYGNPLDKDRLVGVLAQLDPSPDNVAPCVWGGFVVVRSDPDTNHYLGCIKFPVSEEISFIVVSPETRVKTHDSRDVLPKQYPFCDAVRSINSAAYTVGVFASEQYERLTHAVADFIHEPYRLRLSPLVREAIDAGVSAGAYTGWLSGSGSSVLCVAPSEKAALVGQKMSKVYADNGVACQLFQLKADNEGIRVVG